MLALKRTLAKEVEETFLLAQADSFAHVHHAFHEITEKGHGHIETRRHWIIDDVKRIAYLNKKGAWKGLKSIGMIESERRIEPNRHQRDTLLTAEL